MRLGTWLLLAAFVYLAWLWLGRPQLPAGMGSTVWGSGATMSGGGEGGFA